MFQNLVLASPQLPGPPDLGIQMEHRVEIADRKNLQQGEEGVLSGGVSRQWQRGFAKFPLQACFLRVSKHCFMGGCLVHSEQQLRERSIYVFVLYQRSSAGSHLTPSAVQGVIGTRGQRWAAGAVVLSGNQVQQFQLLVSQAADMKEVHPQWLPCLLTSD